MDKSKILLLSITLLLSGFALTYAASEQQGSATEQPPSALQDMSAQGVVASPVQSEPEILWVWGEVTAVDPVNKSLTLKYLDYETDQEKDINISVDDKTNYESIKSLDEVKVKNTLSVDYLTQGGSNIAKNISLEKGETPASEAPQMGSEELPVPAPASPGQP